jgi:aspartyl-tRNA(Asn)/glutamyl-tRNA(Gln) amidotransferase subunit C
MVTPTEVERVAHLARLHLDAGEREKLASHLSAVLEHAATLATLDLDDILPTATVAPVQSVVRAGDEPVPSMPRAEVLANAAATDGASFVVQATLGDDAA